MPGESAQRMGAEPPCPAGPKQKGRPEERPLIPNVPGDQSPSTTTSSGGKPLKPIEA